MILVRAVALLALVPYVAVCQTGRVMGRVVDKLAGVALPYSGVSIVGQSVDRFTSDSGAFQLEAAPGTIHLRIRHVGFTPADTQLVVRANDTTRVTNRAHAHSRHARRDASDRRAMSAARRADRRRATHFRKSSSNYS